MWESRWPPPFGSEGRVSSEEEIRSSFFCIGLSGFNGRDGVDGLWVKGNGDNVDTAVFCMFSQFDDSCGKRKLTFDIINKHWHGKSPAATQQERRVPLWGLPL